MTSLDKSKKPRRQRKELTYTLADAGIELPKALTTQKHREICNKNNEGNTSPLTPLQGTKTMSNLQNSTVTSDNPGNLGVPDAGGVNNTQALADAMAPVLQQFTNVGARIEGAVSTSLTEATKRLDEREAALSLRESEVNFKQEALDLARFSIKAGIVIGAAGGVILIARKTFSFTYVQKFETVPQATTGAETT